MTTAEGRNPGTFGHAAISKDDAYYAQVRRAVGEGTRSLLFGTSTKALDRAVRSLEQSRKRSPISDQVRQKATVKNSSLNMRKPKIAVFGYSLPTVVGLLAIVIGFAVEVGFIIADPSSHSASLTIKIINYVVVIAVLTTGATKWLSRYLVGRKESAIDDLAPSYDGPGRHDQAGTTNDDQVGQD